MPIALLAAVMKTSTRTLRSVADETGLRPGNLSNALAGKRSFPANKKLAFMEALGLAGNGEPIPNTVIAIIGENYECRKELKTVMLCWFPDGASYRVINKYKTGKSKSKSKFINSGNSYHKIILIYDSVKRFRVSVRLFVEKAEDYEEFDENGNSIKANIFDEGYLESIGIKKSKPARVIDDNEFAVLMKTVPSKEEFDKLFNGQGDERSYDWNDVIEISKKYRLEPIAVIDIITQRMQSSS